jgi:hypothetical protein
MKLKVLRLRLKPEVYQHIVCNRLLQKLLQKISEFTKCTGDVIVTVKVAKDRFKTVKYCPAIFNHFLLLQSI